MRKAVTATVVMLVVLVLAGTACSRATKAPGDSESRSLAESGMMPEVVAVADAPKPAVAEVIVTVAGPGLDEVVVYATRPVGSHVEVSDFGPTAKFVN
jgi:hypothetical protein